MRKTVNFWTHEKEVEFSVPIPSPAKKEVPQWYKSLPRFFEGSKQEINDRGSDNLGVKACIPFYDAMTAGYVIKLHCDIYVSLDQYGKQVIQWKSTSKPLTARPETAANQVPQIDGFTSFMFAWEILYHYILPRGYSAIVTQPMNRYDLPFITTSAIVDGDRGIGPGAVAFALNEKFTGIIKAGTPIIQVIPFKRKSWKTKLIGKQHKRAINFTPYNEEGWYKKHLWKRKSYE